MVQGMMNAAKRIRKRNCSNRLKCSKIHHSREFKCGKYRARIITRKSIVLIDSTQVEKNSSSV